ncbi:MAG: menaquinone biosynthetic enzyme MqnA/MqnD family protein [Luteitalea sp.]
MIRVGAVGFLNARPLVHGLDAQPVLTLRLDVPSVCADLLHAGHIDIGLVPAIELLRGPVTYDVVPGLAIGCRGAVNSVAIFTRVPIDRVRRLALDVSSRSSVGLARVLCRQQFDIDPVLVDAAPDLAAMLDFAEAALLIGDPALQAPWQALGAEKIDLGEAWQTLTGLPFVFAVWAAQPGVLSSSVVSVLQEACRVGQAAIPAIAAAAAGDDVARVPLLVSYLRDNIRYELDDAALRGLGYYLALAAADGLAPERPEVLRRLAMLHAPAGLGR